LRNLGSQDDGSNKISLKMERVFEMVAGWTRLGLVDRPAYLIAVS